MVDRRKDPNYEQVTGHVRRDLARRFKVFCTERRITIAEALDAAISLFLKNQPGELSEEQNFDESEAVAFLELLAKGIKPSDAQIVGAAHETDLTEEQLMELRDRLFPKRAK